jgi:hypothetical protein
MSYYGPQQPGPPQQYPAQQYPYPQQPTVGPAPQPLPSQSFLSDPRLIIGMVLGIISGIMLMISVFMAFVSVCQTSTFYTTCVSANPGGLSYFGMTNDLGNEFAYGYLLPIFGILVLVFGILAPILRNKNLATMTWVFGMVGIVMAVVLLMHFMLRVLDAMGTTFSPFYTYSVMPAAGFFVAIIGAILGLVGGFMLGKQISQLQQFTMPQAPMGAPYEVQPYYPPQPPPQQPPPSY